MHNGVEKIKETKQTYRYHNKEEHGSISEIDEFCKQITDKDVRQCTRYIFLLAEKKKNRKISKVEILHLIARCTGKHRRSVLENISRRIKNHGIFFGCELGHSVIVRQLSEIRRFSFKGGFAEEIEKKRKK